MRPIFNALIRTHHITSRKKVAKLKQAAIAQDVFVLIRYGGAPGVMYCEGREAGVTEWVSAVQVRRKAYWQPGRARLTGPEPEVQGLPARVAAGPGAAREPALVWRASRVEGLA